MGFVKFNEVKSEVIAYNDANNLVCQGRNLMVKFSNNKEGELKGKKKGGGKNFNRNNNIDSNKPGGNNNFNNSDNNSSWENNNNDNR